MENETELTRILLLGNKAELTKEELAEIVDLPHENININSLKKYTTKKYRDLSDSEKTELIKELLAAEPYIKYKNCWIAKSKLLYDSSETLAKETAALSRLSDLGYEVYLLPYAYARDNMNCYQKSADSVTNKNFLEFKSVISTGDRAGQSCYEDARRQADNIYISFVNETNEEKIINNIYRSIGVIKKGNEKHGIANDFEGLLFLNFEKTLKTSVYKISKDGYVIKQKELKLNLKKYKGIAQNDSPVVADPITKYGSLPKYKETVRADFQAVGNPMAKHGSSRVSNISQSSEKSTVQSVKLSNDDGTAQLFNKVVKLRAKNIELEEKVKELTSQLEKANERQQKQNSKDYDFGRS